MNRTTMALLLALAVTSLSIARGSITVDQSPPSTPGNGNNNYSLAFVSYSPFGSGSVSLTSLTSPFPVGGGGPYTISTNDSVGDSGSMTWLTSPSSLSLSESVTLRPESLYLGVVTTPTGYPGGDVYFTVDTTGIYTFTGSYSVSGGSISGNPGEAIWNADISSPGYGGTLAADLLPSPATGSSTFTPRNVSLTANVIYDWHTVPVTLTDPGTSTATIAETFNLAAPQGSQGATVPEPASLIVWSLLGCIGIGFRWWRNRKAV